jgi:hypothetical protein
MEAQLHKLSAYADWAHMKVNAGKSFVSGLLHKLADDMGGYGSVEPMLRAQLRQMRVQGQEVTYLPPSAPFRYLGVTLTMTLDWRPNFEAVMAKAKGHAQALHRSLATGRQIVKLAEIVLRPGITSSFSVAPFTPMQIRMLDSVLVGAYKRAYRQRRSTPTAAVHEDPGRFGMGCTSLLVGYAQESVKQLTHAYNADDAYGIVTRNLLREQARALGGLDASELGAAAMLHLRIRQLTAARAGKLTIVNKAEEQVLDLQGTDVYRIVTAVRAASGEAAALAASRRVLLPLLNWACGTSLTS